MSELQGLLCDGSASCYDAPVCKSTASIHEEEDPRSNETPTSVRQETKTIARTSVPVAAAFFLQYSLSVVPIFTVGRIGQTELAAVSLATMTFNITGSIYTGMASCLDTLCAQAHGAQNHRLVGSYYQACLALICTFNIPLVALWWCSGPLFSLVVADPDVASLAQSYLRVAAFATPAFIFFETTKRYLQAQDIFVAGQYVLLIVAPVNLVLNRLLVWNARIGLGSLGAPVATTLSYWLAALLLLGYIRFIDGRKCWYGVHLHRSLQHWGTILPLALNGTAMLLSEFVAFEVLTLSSARFGTSALAAQAIVSTLATLSFQIPFAASVASATRIASLLGSGSGLDASAAARAAYLLGLGIGLVSFSLLFSLKSFLIPLFTTDSKVMDLSASLMTVLAINQLADSPNIVAAGILRAQGRQALGSRLNLIAYYLVALPVALYLGFVCGLELEGLWIGLGLGVLCLAVSESSVVLSTDWGVMTEKANRNSHSSVV